MSDYKYDKSKGKYYRKATDGTWFQVDVNNKGLFVWKQPDGRIIYDPNSDKIKVEGEGKAVPVYNGRRIVNVPFRSFYANPSKYTNKLTDPSENIINDMIFGAATGMPKIIYKGGKALVKGAVNLGKGFVKSSSKEGVKKTIKKGAKNVATKTVETAIREVPRVTVSIGVGKAVDAATELLTGKTFGENVSEGLSQHWGFNVPTEVGDMTNPGYYKGYKLMDRAIKRASFNQITPLAYHDGLIPLTKFEEGIELIKDVPKLMFNVKSIEKPAWRKRFEDAKIDLEIPISNEHMLNNREDALRLVFGQPQKYNTYIKNPDGTYSYNLETLYLQNNPRLSKNYLFSNYYYKACPANDSYGKWVDELGYNGGYIKLTEKNGIYYIQDVFDVQPFKDHHRLPSFKGAEFMHEYLPDLEVFNALGGKPFELKMLIRKSLRE